MTQPNSRQSVSLVGESRSRGAVSHRSLLIAIHCILALACNEPQSFPTKVHECIGKECDSKTTASISVRIFPTSKVLAPLELFAFSAIVDNTDNKKVTWKVSEGDEGGQVSITGLYTAPDHAGVYTLLVASQAEPKKTAVAKITIQAPPEPGLSITPQAPELVTLATVSFSASLIGNDSGVVWEVFGNSDNGNITQAGVYAAPATPGVYEIIAHSGDDTIQKSVWASVRPSPVCDVGACAFGTSASGLKCNYSGADKAYLSGGVFDYQTFVAIPSATIHVLRSDGSKTGVCGTADGTGYIQLQTKQDSTAAMLVTVPGARDTYRYNFNLSSAFSGFIYSMSEATITEAYGEIDGNVADYHPVVYGTVYKNDGSTVVNYWADMTLATSAGVPVYYVGDYGYWPSPDEVSLSHENGKFGAAGLDIGPNTLSFYYAGAFSATTRNSFVGFPKAVILNSITCTGCY